MRRGQLWIVGAGGHGKVLTVSEGTHVGVGALVRKNTRIGARSTMGAGSAVVRDLPNGIVAFRVLARLVRPSVSVPVHEVQL